jgi:hypothetical protein
VDPLRDPEAAATVLDRKPRRDDAIVARIEGFDGRGRACGTSGAYRVRLRRGVPGEVVRARVLRRRRDLIEAIRVEAIAPSAHAVPPRCAHFGACGGCSFQDLGYAAQLEGKRRLIASAYAASGLVSLAVEAVRPSPATFAYRNKMEFSFGNRRWIDPGEPAGAPSGFALGLRSRIRARTRSCRPRARSPSRSGSRLGTSARTPVSCATSSSEWPGRAARSSSAW